MKINIVCISGGLGNQMFQYAFYLSLRYIHCKKDLNLIYISKYNKHNGYELDDVFGIKRNFIINFFVGVLKKILRICGAIIRESDSYYFEIFERDNCRPFVVYSGYWQNEEYFKAIKNKVTHAFNFKDKNLNYQSTILLIKIKNSNSVGIHIRRGDYENDSGIRSVHGGICDISYYIKAVNYIQSIVEKPVYYVFSDDIDWAVKNVKFLIDPVFVYWNKRKDSWQDMMLMSSCNHNIIANSSFSWWSAWLNDNPNKIVVAPSKWFNTVMSAGIIPEKWVRL